MTPQEHLTVSFESLRRARSTLEDFALSYFPYYGLKLPEDLLKHLDVLVWVEATIYQLDEDNEALARQGKVQEGRGLLAESVVEEVLAAEGLMDPDLKSLLQQGDMYWQGERELCQAMLHAGGWHERTLEPQPPEQLEPEQPSPAPLPAPQLLPAPPQQIQTSCQPQEGGAARAQGEAGSCLEASDEGQQGYAVARHEAPSGLSPPLCLERVLEVHEAKSFDYKVLHLLLRKLSGRPRCASLDAFLSLDELLVDISDDLVDYEDDVEANAFNLLRAYVHLYGPEAPRHLVARISSLELQHAALLADLPQAMQEHYWQNHTRATSASDAQGADRWQFPALILDETEFRERCATSSSSNDATSSSSSSSSK